MTLLESLQDIGKGRVIDTGCDYELIALAKGTYHFEFNSFSHLEPLTVTLTGKQGENARELKRAYYNHNRLGGNSITKAEYTPTR